MTIKRKGVEEKLKKDPKVKTFIKEVNYARELEKTETYVSKTLAVQVERVKTSVTAGEVLHNVQRHLAEIRLDNQGYRARIIRFKAECISLFSALDKKYRLLRKYVGTMYASELIAQGYKTKTDRDAWIDSYFFDEVKVINDLDAAIEVFDVVIEDIDSQGFAVKDVTNALNVEFKYKQKEI
jgi:hypothetical protein